MSRIEHGKITELDAVRAYVKGPLGIVDMMARAGDWTVKVT